MLNRLISVLCGTLSLCANPDIKLQNFQSMFAQRRKSSAKTQSLPRTLRYSEGKPHMKRLIAIPLLLICISMLSGTGIAQSGRSWMNGFVFADSDTTGLAGATVELIGDQNSARLRPVKLTTTSEQDGKYSLKDIPYGEYTFRVTAQDYQPYQINLYIGSDMLTQIHVRLKRKK